MDLSETVGGQNEKTIFVIPLEFYSVRKKSLWCMCACVVRQSAALSLSLVFIVIAPVDVWGGVYTSTTAVWKPLSSV